MSSPVAYTIRTLVISAWTVLAIPTMSITAEPVREAKWSSFQNSGSLLAAPAELPTHWSPGQNLAWKTAITGYGQSTPVIAGRQIYLTSVSGQNKDRFHLSAIELETGRKLWQQDFVSPSLKENTPMTSRSSATPIADDSGCVAFFEGGILVAVAADGSIRWQRDLVAEFGAMDGRHGLSSSLEHDSRRVYVWIERSDDPFVLAVDKQTGETVWRVPGVGSTTWGSPRLVPTEHGPHLVCSASGKIVGLHPASGQRLWEFDAISGNTSNTPIPVAPGKFLIGGSDVRGASGAGSNGVIQIKQSASGGFEAEFVWQAEKATSSFGSPILAADSAWFVNRAGVLFRLDINTGEQLFARRIQAGGIWATPIVAGDKLYLFGNKGVTSVVSLPVGEEIATNRLWNPTAEPATGTRPPAAGGPQMGGPILYAATPAPPFLLLRRGTILYAVRNVE